MKLQVHVTTRHMHVTAQKNMFSIKDFFSTVNMTKSAVFCRFGHIY